MSLSNPNYAEGFSSFSASVQLRQMNPSWQIQKITIWVKAISQPSADALFCFRLPHYSVEDSAAKPGGKKQSTYEKSDPFFPLLT